MMQFQEYLKITRVGRKGLSFYSYFLEGRTDLFFFLTYEKQTDWKLNLHFH